tara:strand:+ start:508 stop:1908 length:1401 start_codon:yes stop_codon:yes gene_type:complete
MEKDFFLKGKKIAITAHHLEQKEHRGMASVTKSLIRLFRKYGAEVYLITGFDLLKLLKNNKNYLDKKSINEIKISDIKFIFENGKNDRELFQNSQTFKFKLVFELLGNLFELSTNKFRFRYTFLKVKKEDTYQNEFDTRTDFLKDINGFYCIKNIFNICRLRSMRLLIINPKLNIEKDNIDLIISSSPLSLGYKKGNAEIIQLIHDAIPLQWGLENPKVFRNKLFDAHHNSKCFYVSKESRKVVLENLNIKGSKFSDSIIYPTPSLRVRCLEKACNQYHLRSIIQPFILLNSSIVEYKKVENAINYFKSSDLPKRNFLLCVAGKLHKSKYCEFIKEICRENRNILLLDYVNDIEKTWLFLNSSLLISTSSNEGFGIPLLDALSINLTAMATDIPSHREIKALNSNNKIKLIKENDDKTWIANFNNINIFDNKNKQEKLKRVDFFRSFIKDYEKTTFQKFKKLIPQK